MSFVGPGDIVTYLYWLEQVQKLGLGDTKPPGLKERRMFEESGEFNLKVYDQGWVKCNRDADFLNGNAGSFYQNAGNLNAGTIPLARIPTTLAGKDTDKLDGQEGSYYLNASNLNAGTVPQTRLSSSTILTILKTVDGSGSGLDADLYRNAKIQWGTVPNAKDTGVYVYFPEAFLTTPVIILTPRAELTAWKTDITTTYCRIRVNSTVNKTVDWIGIG